MKLKALIFDVDGTLAETEELHRGAFNESFALAGLSWVWDQALYGRLLETTGGKERIRHYIETEGARPRLDDQAIGRLHASKTALYGELVAEGRLQLRPGIKTLLDECQATGVRLAVATTTSRSNVDALLSSTLGYDPFEVIAAGDEVTAKKPAPDVYTLALDRLGVPPDRCIAVEDTLNGLLSASQAGVSCVVTVSVYGGLGPFPGALAVVDQLGDEHHPMRVVSGPPIMGTVGNLATLQAWLNTARGHE